MGVYEEINFKIKGQVKDHNGGIDKARQVKAELDYIAAKYGLEIEEG